MVDYQKTHRNVLNQNEHRYYHLANSIIYQYSEILDQEPLMPNHRGIGHLAFEVDSVHHVLRKMVEHGGQSFGDIIEKEVPGVGILTFTYARDPEGNLIELQSWA